jgi:hypothetical protein
MAKYARSPWHTQRSVKNSRVQYRHGKSTKSVGGTHTMVRYAGHPRR